jgi:hypothetical protein
MKIKIFEWPESVTISVTEPDGNEIRYSFEKEDTHRILVDLFNKLGFNDVTYEEAY